MTCLDAIFNRARADMVLTTEQGDTDLFLWEHTARVAHGAKQILRLPQVQARRPDQTAVVAAALYHDAGWAVGFHEGGVDRLQILLTPCTDANREAGAQMMERSLTGVAPPESLERAARAVRALNERKIDLIEGQVVFEADSLDEFGLLSLWRVIRRGAADGKGVQSVIDKWLRQKEYQFWNARLKDSFRFASVRDVARNRLEEFERFMEELAVQHHGRDIAALPTEGEMDRVSHPVGS